MSICLCSILNPYDNFHFVAGLKEPDHKPTVIPNVHYDLDRLLLPITAD